MHWFWNFQFRRKHFKLMKSLWSLGKFQITSGGVRELVWWFLITHQYGSTLKWFRINNFSFEYCFDRFFSYYHNISFLCMHSNWPLIAIMVEYWLLITKSRGIFFSNATIMFHFSTLVDNCCHFDAAIGSNICFSFAAATIAQNQLYK